MNTTCCREDAAGGLLVYRNQIRHGREGLYTQSMKDQAIEGCVEKTMKKFAEGKTSMTMEQAD